MLRGTRARLFRDIRRRYFFRSTWGGGRGAGMQEGAAAAGVVG
ncbi:hypothetical protein [Nocardia sp. NPDC002869]